MHISKEGDSYLRTLLVQGAHHILGPFGPDSDLRRWGLKLAERGGKNGKKRAIVATRAQAGGVAASLVGDGRSTTNLCATTSGRCRQQLRLTKVQQVPKAEFR